MELFQLKLFYQLLLISHGEKQLYSQKNMRLVWGKASSAVVSFRMNYGEALGTDPQNTLELKHYNREMKDL